MDVGRGRLEWEGGERGWDGCRWGKLDRLLVGGGWNGKEDGTGKGLRKVVGK